MALVFGQAEAIRGVPITNASPADGDMLVYSSTQAMWVTAASPFVVVRDDTDCGYFVDTVSEAIDCGSFV